MAYIDYIDKLWIEISVKIIIRAICLSVSFQYDINNSYIYSFENNNRGVVKIKT